MSQQALSPRSRAGRPSATEIASLLASVPDRDPDPAPGSPLSAPMYVPALVRSLLLCLLPRHANTPASGPFTARAPLETSDPSGSLSSQIECRLPTASAGPPVEVGVPSEEARGLSSPKGASTVCLSEPQEGSISESRDTDGTVPMGPQRVQPEKAPGQSAEARMTDGEAGHAADCRDALVGEVLERLCRRGHVSHVTQTLWSCAGQGGPDGSGAGLVQVQRAVQAVQQGPCLQQVVTGLLCAAGGVQGDRSETLDEAAGALHSILDGPLWERPEVRYAALPALPTAAR